ncbi:hypothetical protein BZA05DRAFT_408380 [Tricharina praecox]|uniref:uncharacterized protein n=1 Tax=Tricharina praecox TaxID=43433 RepID=UPI0022205ED2|nr:uncharacterized protein BZA05DRAFT_408380 [Tricharina praecox]KAI5845392.1 hypothetical protein BZA05DRAFT_408380 [Tricharina praecox]
MVMMMMVVVAIDCPCVTLSALILPFCGVEISKATYSTEHSGLSRCISLTPSLALSLLWLWLWLGSGSGLSLSSSSYLPYAFDLRVRGEANALSEASGTSALPSLRSIDHSQPKYTPPLPVSARPPPPLHMITTHISP